MQEATVSLEALIAHQDWIRRLASRLIANPDAAEDLVQDTWLIALQHPDRVRSPAGRSWLATVLRNLAHERWRKDQRRVARERQVARAEASGADAAASLEEFESCRAVMDHVLALPEPQRDLLIELYFKRRTSAQVGAAIGVTASAIRNRHAAALGALRRRLDVEHDGRRDRWSQALAALALPTEATRPTRWLLGAAAVALATGGAWYALQPTDLGGSAPSLPTVAALEPPAVTPPAGLVEPAQLTTTPATANVAAVILNTPRAEQPTRAEAPAQLPPTSGRESVRRVSGLVTPAPASTAEAYFVVDPALARALGRGPNLPRPVQRLGRVSKDGRFQFHIDGESPGRIVVLVEGHAPTWAELGAREERSDLELRLQPGMVISGSLPQRGAARETGVVAYRALDVQPLEDLDSIAWSAAGLRRAEGRVALTSGGEFTIAGLEQGRYALRFLPDVGFNGAQYEQVATWNGGRPFDERLTTELDFFSAPGQVVSCPNTGVELHERAEVLNVFVVHEGALLGDCWVQREDRRNYNFGTNGVITCRYGEGTNFALRIERAGFKPRRIEPLQLIDSALGGAVVEMTRNQGAKQVWLEMIGDGPANLEVSCEVEDPGRLRMQRPSSHASRLGRIHVVDGTGGAGTLRVAESSYPRYETGWYVDWTMPASELVDGSVIPVHMVVGGRVRVDVGNVRAELTFNLEARAEGKDWFLLGAYSMEGTKRGYVDPLAPGKYELRVRPFRGEAGVSVPFDIKAREFTEVTLP